MKSDNSPWSRQYWKYSFSQLNNFSCTSLIGKAGPPGSEGPKGDRGESGQKGMKGHRGLIGLQGNKLAYNKT